MKSHSCDKDIVENFILLFKRFQPHFRVGRKKLIAIYQVFEWKINFQVDYRAVFQYSWFV